MTEKMEKKLRILDGYLFLSSIVLYILSRLFDTTPDIEFVTFLFGMLSLVSFLTSIGLLVVLIVVWVER